MEVLDLSASSLRDVNAALQAEGEGSNKPFEISNPRGSHAIAVGLDAPVLVTVKGSTGYYCGGMNKQATIHVEGSVGPGVGERRCEAERSRHRDRRRR